MIQLKSNHRLKTLAYNFFAASFLVYGLVASTARAGLGQKPEAVETDRLSLSATNHPTTTKANYKIHEMVNKRVTVREFESNGTIFAIAWSGSRHPDLKNLLGDYFADFSKASQSQSRMRGRHGYGIVRGQNISVERWGHMRWVQGRAIANDLLLKSGVSKNDIH